ncbi:MAG TPA: LysM peptidoglycan-binding domain-containing protein [Anaeromyxobacteraceae bacterium]|nr:LysM peptidoglycan-binding domain-containing protein [Anaeromyxobacteraceae bacterium]
MIRIRILAAWSALALAQPTLAADAEPGPEASSVEATPAAATPAVAAPAVAAAADADPATPTPPGVLDAGDAPEVEEVLEAQSAEIDEVRVAEEKAALVPLPHPEDGAAREADRLGTESPIRRRIDGALSRDTAPMPEEDAGTIALLPEVGHDLRRLQAEYDIPIDVNEAVVQYVRFFQTPVVRKHFVKWLGRLPRYQERYRAILREAGLPEDTIYLAMIESGFANLAYSRAKAAGPWQFIASTGKRMGLSQDFWVDERRDPEKSARAAAAYLKALYAEFGDWRLAWAGYNAGEGKIEKAKRKGQLDFWEMARGKILKRETKGYVPKLMAAAIIAKHPEAFGFRAEEIEAERWTEYERVTIPHAVELEAVARAAEVTTKELHDLNPELRRSCTPPRSWSVKLPVGAAEAFARNWPEIGPAAALGFARHTVVKGEGVAAVAAAYGVPASTVLQMNGLKAGKRVKPGTELVIPLTALARRSGAPASETVARARIGELQKKNPALVEKEPVKPASRAAVARAPATASPGTVLVQSGDSLWAIAQRLGIGLKDLCDWNGIKNPKRHKLQVGQELVVRPPSSQPAVRAAG